MDVSEIVDHESFQRWLEETKQPREVCVALAHRAAMRVLPLAWNWFQQSPKVDLTALTILRCILVSSGTYWLKVSEETIHATARAADAAANATAAAAAVTAAAAHATARAADAAADADIAANTAAYSVAYADIAAAHATANTDIAAARATASVSLRRDCQSVLEKQDLDTFPLWVEIREEILTTWINLAQTLKTEAARTNEAATLFDPNALDWTFFVDWYDRALDPQKKPQFSEDLLTEIIVTGDVDWDAKPAVVLDQINAIWRKHQIGKTPNAERLIENPATKKIYSEPDSEIPDDHLQDAVDMLSDAMRAFGSFEGGNAPYAGLSYEFELLTDTLARYGRNPVRLYDRTRQVHNSIHRRAKLGDCPEIDKDPKLADFCGQLGQVQEDLKAFDPKVKAKIKGRANSAVEDASDELEQQISQADAALAPILEGDLGFSFKEDVQLFCDPTTPLTTKGDALYRISSRVFRIVHGAYHPAKTATKDAVFWSASISAIAVSQPVQALYHALMRLF